MGGVIFALPEGLENAYFITAPKTQTNDSNNYELALIDSNGNCDESKTTFHESEYTAKLQAQEQFTELLLKHISVAYKI